MNGFAGKQFCRTVTVPGKTIAGCVIQGDKP
jgi:hypothetical protein